mmetsp:Transcript_5051/g.13088  ORF Transcript_5051/g.13088 Transcript_5051/m.13088 type:complete len:283 (+) Transcript_5051:280-1128(+)
MAGQEQGPLEGRDGLPLHARRLCRLRGLECSFGSAALGRGLGCAEQLVEPLHLRAAREDERVHLPGEQQPDLDVGALERSGCRDAHGHAHDRRPRRLELRDKARNGRWLGHARVGGEQHQHFGTRASEAESLERVGHPRERGLGGDDARRDAKQVLHQIGVVAEGREPHAREHARDHLPVEAEQRGRPVVECAHSVRGGQAYDVVVGKPEKRLVERSVGCLGQGLEADSRHEERARAALREARAEPRRDRRAVAREHNPPIGEREQLRRYLFHHRPRRERAG